MSVDVSNRRFYMNESPALESKSISGSFTSKSPAGNYGQRWGQILVSTTDIRYYYLAGSYVQVYSSGAWVNSDYRVIVFAPDTSLLDYEYEWLAANSTEVTPYFTSNESLGQVANAIRERSWTKSLLTYPDGYDAAIRAIGNYAEGATVAWNQLVRNGNFADGTSEWGGSSATLSASDGILTVTKNQNTGSGVGYARQYGSHLTLNHKYIFVCDYKGIAGKQLTLFTNNSAAGMTSVVPTDSDWHTVEKIANITTMPSVDCIFWLNYATTTDDNVAQFRNINFIDLTILLGSTIADYLYTLETNTAGAGVAAFRSLFPKDYYTTQVTPVLASVNYQDDIPVNDPVELLGVYRLDSDNNIIRDGDVYNDGQMYKRYVEIALDGLTWTYNSTYDFFSAGPVGPDSRSVTGPYAQDLFINAISDYEPLTLWDYGTRTESELAAAADGMYLCYISTVQAAAINLLYIKDSTITSDHENTLMGKLAGKKIIMAYTNPYYTTT